MQLDVAGNVAFFGNSTQPAGKFDRVMSPDTLVAIARDNPDGTSSEFLCLTDLFLH